MLIIESIENLLNRVYNIFKRNQRRKHKHHKIIAINRRRRSRCLRGALCLHRAASAWAEINIKMFSSIAAGNRLQWLISSIDHVIHQASSGNSSSDVTKPLAFSSFSSCKHARASREISLKIFYVLLYIYTSYFLFWIHIYARSEDKHWAARGKITRVKLNRAGDSHTI